MAYKNQEKFKECYRLFLDAYRNKKTVSKEEILDDIGWKNSTFDTYYGKKWGNNILKKVDSKNKIYEVINLEQYEEDSFVKMMSQNLSSSAEPFRLEASEEVIGLLNRAVESAYLAVDIYNRPQTTFRSSGFIVMMIIAWTSLLHSYFEDNNIDYYHKNNSKEDIIIDDDKKTWELTTCLKNFDKLSQQAKENLEFLIKIRNKIEHRSIPLLDLDLCGYCQSCLLNFENTIVALYGKHYSLNSGLAMPLQLTNMTEEQYINAKKEFHTKNYEILKNFITEYNSQRENSVLNSDEYCFKVYLISKIGNHRSSSDMAIEFIQFKDLNEEEIKQMDKNIALIKEKQVPVINLGLYLPNQVVKKVNESLNCGFTIPKHTKMWQKHKVRIDKDNTNTKYCLYESTHGDFVYTDAWVKFLIDELNKQS